MSNGTPGTAIAALRLTGRARPMPLLTTAMPAGARRTHRSGWLRRKRARPSEILAAASEVFARQGYDRTRMIDIARLAGVSIGTIYLYFASKAELFDFCRRDEAKHKGIHDHTEHGLENSKSADSSPKELTQLAKYL